MALLYLDSCIFVAAFEVFRGEHDPLTKLFQTLERHPGAAVTSELTLAELLASVKRASISTMGTRRELYLELLDEGQFISLVPISRSILIDTARVRSEYSRRLPDAIHVSTAIHADCRFFVSFDRDARRLPPSLGWKTPSVDDVATVIAALDA